MNTWSTASLPRRDRFEYWREERARRLFGVEAEIEPERRLDFTGRIGASKVGSATLVEVEVSSYAMHRTQQAIDRTPDGSLYVRHLLRGGGLTITGAGEERVVRGAISSGLSDVPYTNLPDHGGPEAGNLVAYRAVRIPLSALPPLMVAPDRLATHQHRQPAGVDALLRAYLVSFFEQAPHLGGAAAEQAIQTLAQLVLAARGAGDVRDEPARAAIRHGLLDRARTLIEQNLHRADLSPAQVAGRLGISVRKLHLVFEPTGESFGRHVLARRLARADRLLGESPTLPVTEVAYASGFDSLSTFFRCYRAAFGASPGERRATLPSHGEIAVLAAARAAHREDGPGLSA